MGLFSRKKKKQEGLALLEQMQKQAEARSRMSDPVYRLQAIGAQLPTEGLSEDERLAVLVLAAERDASLIPALRRETIPAIRSDEVLYALAAQAKDRDIRLEAEYRIQDWDVLTRCALEMTPYGAWKIMEKLREAPDGAKRLHRLGTQAKEQKVRKDAMHEWAKLLDTPEAWLECARTVQIDDGLYKISDMELLAKALVEDDSAHLRDAVAQIAGGKLPTNALVQYVLREDNDLQRRARIAEIVLHRGWHDEEGRFDALLPELMDHSRNLVYEMAKRGDGRAVPLLAARALSHPESGTAPTALANIHTAESVQALLHLMQTDHQAGSSAAGALKQIYKKTDDPALRDAIDAIERKTYFKHTDAGTHGESCHTDIPAVIFDLKEE